MPNPGEALGRESGNPSLPPERRVPVLKEGQCPRPTTLRGSGWELLEEKGRDDWTVAGLGSSRRPEGLRTGGAPCDSNEPHDRGEGGGRGQGILAELVALKEDPRSPRKGDRVLDRLALVRRPCPFRRGVSVELGSVGRVGSHLRPGDWRLVLCRRR